MKRGHYKKDIFENERIAKTILLLATGIKFREQLTESGIRTPTWDNSDYGYRKKLLDATLIREKDTDKINKRGVIKEYIFNWEILLNKVFDIIYDDVQENNESLTKTYNQSKYRVSKVRYELEKKRKYLNKKVSELKAEEFAELPQNLKEFDRKFHKTKRDYRTHELLQREFDAQQKIIQSFLDNIKNINTKLKITDKNWLICQLISYFKELLLVENEFVSLKEIIRRFLLSIVYKGALPMELPYEMREHPFNHDKVNQGLILSLLKNYRELVDIKVEWLIVLKPKDKEYWEKAAEEHERQMAEEDEKRAKEWDMRYSEDLKKAKTLDQRYGVVYDYYGKGAADTFLNDEMDKLRESIKIKEVILKSK